MRAPLSLIVCLMTAPAVLTACAAGPEVTSQDTLATSGAAQYQGIETILLDGDLVNFRVAMTGARDELDVEAYGRCAAAQYALIRGFGFARHVRTTVAQDDDIWRGDAVYTISAALPRGLKTIDAEVTVRDCGAQRIPTV
ncbi:MAG: hypothetical protein V4804_07055 [Pseudomonadota bacterium]